MWSKFAFKLGASVHEASAVADDAVLDLVRRERRDDLAPIGAEEGWLVTVVKNKVLDILARRDTTPATDTQVLAERLEQVTCSSPERRLEAMEVLHALQNMPNRYKVPVILAAEGWSTKEIGDLLEVSESVASKRVSRGRQYLRKLTGNDEGGTE